MILSVFNFLNITFFWDTKILTFYSHSLFYDLIYKIHRLKWVTKNIKLFHYIVIFLDVFSCIYKTYKTPCPACSQIKCLNFLQKWRACVCNLTLKMEFFTLSDLSHPMDNDHGWGLKHRRTRKSWILTSWQEFRLESLKNIPGMPHFYNTRYKRSQATHSGHKPSPYPQNKCILRIKLPWSSD